MARNVEIKARVNGDLGELIRRVLRFTGMEMSELKTFTQSDVFFNLPADRPGLLKFRESQLNDLPELIYYNREKCIGPKLSTFNKCFVPEELKTVLINSLGKSKEVKKTRKLLLVGQTRIHFDTVKDLGNFVELEVVLTDNQTVEEGQQIAKDLVSQMGLDKKDMVSGAYADMLQQMC